MQHKSAKPSKFLLIWSMVFALVVSLFLPAAQTGFAASGAWEQFNYSGTPGARPYFVYTPAGYTAGTSVPMVVMLHGCTQTPADFAAGTAMNNLADANNFIVVYPQQTSQYNQNQCWQWFNPSHQSRGSGEPAIIAEITKAVMNNTSKWTIDKSRVYIAGMSAGGAMTTIMGAAYPDIYAAIGVASGLEYKAATSESTAWNVMSQGGPNPVTQGQAAYNAMGSNAKVMPTIVFHGTSDYTVSQINGDQVTQQYLETNRLASNNTFKPDYNAPTSKTTGQAPGTQGRTYTLSKWNDNNGNLIQEYWKVNSMGHAWSGGSTAGSYTDPNGPNASQAMYDFFMKFPQGPTVAVSPAGGSYSSSVSVSLTATPSGASIYYTTDGSTPTAASTLYTGPITLSQTTTLKFFAVDSAGRKSGIQTQTYTISTPAPVVTASPSGDTYGAAANVALSANQTGTSIYYTTDGTTPTTASTKYVSPIAITSSKTLKYFGVNGSYQSQVASQVYTITPIALTASPAGGTYSGAQSVSLSMNMPGKIYYTTDGTTPTTLSTLYSGPIKVSTTQTLKYIGVDLAGNQSTVQTQAYTITAPPVTQTLTFKSVAADDGYMYQSSTSGQPNSMLNYIEVGSTSLNQGERGVLSFDTSTIPAGATITSATITLYRYDNTLYYYDLGPLTADISPIGGFNGNYALEQADFAATAALSNIGNFDAVPTAQYQAISDSISQGALAYINRGGKTQFRIHFEKNTANRYAIDVLRFFSGNSAGAYVPTLKVEYY